MKVTEDYEIMYSIPELKLDYKKAFDLDEKIGQSCYIALSFSIPCEINVYLN